MTALSTHDSTATVAMRPAALAPEIAGRKIAERRAGELPDVCTLTEFQLACDRAWLAARRAEDLQIRWNLLYRRWSRPDRFEAAQLQMARLNSRREWARHIAVNRDRLLFRLLHDVAGRA